MATSTLSLFLTVLVFAGAQGATPDLDAACDPAADTCTNSADSSVGLACDTLADPDVCKIKVDQACSAEKCVTGAACDTGNTNQCKCGAGYSATASKICEVTANAYGGTCTGGPNAKGSCTDTNAVCSQASAGTCGCKTGYSGSIGANCAQIAANTFGGACTGGPNVKGTCTDTNALCSAASGFCACTAGYTGTDGAGCTQIAANTFGGACTGGPNVKGTCTDTNALCSASSGFCACTAGYTGTNGAGCTKSGAKAVVASVTSLVLACIVCLLAIN